jgi:NAD(P)-dependent dehydrogenase (short-subunit alcohol dehydrogenase family)
MLLMRAALPGMTLRRRGRVIIVSAIASHLTVSGLSAYIVGKTAQKRLGEVLAFETKDHGLAVFSIDPGFVLTQLAADTMNSPDAQRWLPQMVAGLKRMKEGPPQDGDLEKCAQRCLELAGGRYDALSGGYFELPDDLDKLLSERKPA